MGDNSEHVLTQTYLHRGTHTRTHGGLGRLCAVDRLSSTLLSEPTAPLSATRLSTSIFITFEPKQCHCRENPSVLSPTHHQDNRPYQGCYISCCGPLVYFCSHSPCAKKCEVHRTHTRTHTFGALPWMLNGLYYSFTFFVCFESACVCVFCL